MPRYSRAVLSATGARTLANVFFAFFIKVTSLRMKIILAAARYPDILPCRLRHKKTVPYLPPFAYNRNGLNIAQPFFVFIWCRYLDSPNCSYGFIIGIEKLSVKVLSLCSALKTPPYLYTAFSMFSIPRPCSPGADFVDLKPPFLFFITFPSVGLVI